MQPGRLDERPETLFKVSGPWREAYLALVPTELAQLPLSRLPSALSAPEAAIRSLVSVRKPPLERKSSLSRPSGRQFGRQPLLRGFAATLGKIAGRNLAREDSIRRRQLRGCPPCIGLVERETTGNG